MKRKQSIILLAAACTVISLLAGCRKEKETVDDFYDMVNSQWLEENKEYSGLCYGAVQEQQNKVERSLENYLIELSDKNASQAGSLTEIEEKAVILYGQATDMEKRNELGMKPMAEMLAKVEQIRDLEGLIALYKDEEIGFFNTLFGFLVGKDRGDGSYQVYVCPKTICGQYGMLTEEQFAGYQSFIQQEAMLAGYDESRAAEIAEHAVSMERRILELNYYQLQDYSRCEEKSMDLLLSNIPLMEIAKEQGYLENRVTLTCSATHLRLLQELFVEENTGLLKDYLLAALIVKSAPYLNEEMAKCYEMSVNALMGADKSEEDTYAGYQIVKTAMEDFLAEYYMEQYVGEELKQEVQSMTEEIRGEFREKILEADWMSERTKNYAVKKLESMQLIVGLPQKTHDYSGLTVKSYEEGGNLVENILNAYILDCNFQKELLKEECEKVYYFHPLEVNASYAPMYNAFAINAAIITLDDCGKESKYEEKLATLGFTIAHEMSHGFDGMGSNYTIEGICENWWTAEDKAAYRERINKVKHYFDGMEVKENLTLVGEKVMDETYTDLSAMSVCMDLLSNRKDSDYKLFFEAYGRMERIVITDELLTYLVNNDGHLPGKLRVNQIVNQMDEFYQVYQVPEEGSMYVKEEERLQVWK